MWNLKYDTNESIYKTKRLTIYTIYLWLPSRGECDGWGGGVGWCEVLHLEWINSEVLLYSTGKYIQSLGIKHNGR